MALYNRLAAVNYALKWAVGGGNPIWPDYHQTSGGGGDCTNFISQCLYAGGWEMRYGGQNIFAWYCWPKRRWDHSKSWTSADYFGFLLKNSGRAHPCSLADLSFGDLVSEELPGEGIRHWMLVTQLSPLALSYHSTDYRNTPFQDVQTRVGTNPLYYWKLFDMYDDYDPFWSHGSAMSWWQEKYVEPLQNRDPPPPRS
jgi:hypothetical protein